MGEDIRSISSIITDRTEFWLLGDSELTALSSWPVEVPTKRTSNFDPSGAITWESTPREVKPVLRPVLNTTGAPKKGWTASFIKGWVLMKFRFASESSLLLLGQVPAIILSIRNTQMSLKEMIMIFLKRFHHRNRTKVIKNPTCLGIPQENDAMCLPFTMKA